MNEPTAIAIAVDVPECTLRLTRSNQNIKTHTVPEPNRVYNLVLSLIGEVDKRKHIGTRIAIAVLENPTVSRIIRKIRKHKVNEENSLENSTPEYQEVASGLKFVAHIQSEPGLIAKISQALTTPEEINRFGNLCFGESRDLINEVVLYNPNQTSVNKYNTFPHQWVIPSDSGEHFLNHWIDHSNKSPSSAFSRNYTLELGGTTPPDTAWITIDDQPASVNQFSVDNPVLSYPLNRDPYSNAGIIGLAIAARNVLAAYPGTCKVTATKSSLELKILCDIAQFIQLLCEINYRIDSNGMIDCHPFQGDTELSLLNKYYIHDALCNTFFQHNTSKKLGEKLVKTLKVDPDSDKVIQIAYKKALSYKFQTAYKKLDHTKDVLCITSAEYPGAVVKHGLSIKTSVKLSFSEALANTFAPLACLYRKIKSESGYGYGVVVPHYKDIAHDSEVIGSKDFWEQQDPKNVFAESISDVGYEYLVNRSIPKYELKVDTCTIFEYKTLPWNNDQKALANEITIPLAANQYTHIQQIYDYLGNKYVSKKKDPKAPEDSPEEVFISCNPIRGFLIRNIHQGKDILHGLDSDRDVIQNLRYYAAEVFTILEKYPRGKMLTEFQSSIKTAIKIYLGKRWKECKKDSRYEFDREKEIEKFLFPLYRITRKKLFSEFYYGQQMRRITKHMPAELADIINNDDSDDGWMRYKNSIIAALIAQLAWDETKKKPDGKEQTKKQPDGNESNETNADTQETSDDDDLDADLTLD